MIPEIFLNTKSVHLEMETHLLLFLLLLLLLLFLLLLLLLLLILKLEAFISFPWLILLARTSSTTLKRYGDSRHPYLIPDFRGSSQSFTSKWVTCGFSHYQIEKIFFFGVFFLIKGVGFCQFFFCVHWDDPVSSLYSDNMIYYIDWLTQSSFPEINLNWL